MKRGWVHLSVVCGCVRECVCVSGEWGETAGGCGGGAWGRPRAWGRDVGHHSRLTLQEEGAEGNTTTEKKTDRGMTKEKKEEQERRTRIKKRIKSKTTK